MPSNFIAVFCATLITVCSLLSAPASAQEGEPEVEDDTVVLAETPTILAEKLETDGVYIAPSRNDLQAEVLIAAVKRANEKNVRLVVVVPEDPQPDSSAFARRVQEKIGVDAAIVFPPGGGPIEAYAAQDYESNRTRALNRAQDESNPARVVDVYVEELQDDGSRSVPIFILILIAAILGLLYLAYWSGAKEQQERKRLRAELATAPTVDVVDIN